jgi:16S rRNA (uracil1498-N3)-methyltransferase
MMSAVHRFYAPALDAASDHVVLDAEEARHLSRVLRLAAGADVQVFDGRGLERSAVVEHVGRDQVLLRVGPRVDAARELPFRLTLAQAALKGDAMDAVVRDATMLGVSAIQPTVTARCEAPGVSRSRSGRQERWRRIAISSSKQCRRAVVPQVLEPAAFPAALAAAREGLAVLLTEPAAQMAVVTLRDLPRADQRGATVFVGPEGGWTDGELEEAAASGAHLVTLGDRTLRAESAAIVALPVLLYEWGVL